MFENEYYGIIKFILDAAGRLQVYYHSIPEGFVLPSVYFPMPDIDFKPDTLSSYTSLYTMYVMFFHRTTEEAFQLAAPVFHRLGSAKRLSAVDKSGGKSGIVHLKDIQLDKADECAYQMKIDWVSRYPYNREDAELARNFYMNGGIRV